MAFTVTYSSVDGGSVTFGLAHVSYRGSAVYDTTGRTLQGYNLVFGISSVVAIGVGTGHLALDDIRKALVAPRGTLTISLDGTNMWEIGPSGSGAAMIDRNWGPKPSNLTFTEIINNKSAKISLEISTMVNYFGEFASDIDEFWWAFAYSQDEDFKTIRTVTGRVHARSNVDLPSTVMNNAIYWPTCPKGFKRASTNYRVTPDGQTFDFAVVDRQLWRTLPQPLTGGHATFHIATANMTLTKTLQCQFSAPPDIPKKAIYDHLIAIGRYYFPALAVLPTKQGTPTTKVDTEFLTNFSVDDSVFENTMSMTISTITPASQFTKSSGENAQIQADIIAGLFKDIKDMPVAQPGSVDTDTGSVSYTRSNGTAYLEKVGGSAGLVPQTNDPINMNTGNPASQAEASGGVQPAAGTGSGNQGGGVPLNQNQSPTWSKNHFTYPYVTYVNHLRYILDRHLRVLKVTSSNPTITPDIVQQVANPSMVIIQVGSSRRIGAPPVIPLPPPDTGGNGTDVAVYVEHEEVDNKSPDVLADGVTLQYSSTWNFKYVVTYPKATMSADISIPDHPALDASLVQSYQSSAQVQVPRASGTTGETIFTALGDRPTDLTEGEAIP